MTNATHYGKPPIGVGCALLFVTLLARWRTPLPGDVWIAREIQGWRGVFPDDLARFGNWLGQALIIGIVAAAIAVWFALRRCWTEAGFMAVAYAAKALNGPFKSVVRASRPTPDLVRVTEHAAGWGFPSGHVMGVTLVLGAAALMFDRRVPRYRWLSWTVAAALILITAVGRVWAGAHWPSQTLGGLLAGAFLLIVLDIGRRLFEDRRRSIRNGA